MPIDRQELQKRLGMCTPENTVKGSLFRSVCAELQRLDDVGPAREKLIEHHQKDAWQEFSSFPVTDFLHLIHDAAELLEPRTGNFGDALSMLGQLVADAFFKSVVGRLAVMMASGKSPVDILAYAPAAYSPTANYGKRTFQRVSEGEGILHIREDFLPPEYHLGAVRCGVGINGHHAQIELIKIELLACDLVVRWTPEMDRAAK